MTHAVQMTSPKTLRNFGLLMAGMIAGIFGLVFPLLKSREIPLLPWAIASVFAVLALAAPGLLSLVYRYWIKLGHVLGVINSRIVLAILFWGIVTPISLLFKILRRDALRMKYRIREATTYRVPVAEPTDPKVGMERPF